MANVGWGLFLVLASNLCGALGMWFTITKSFTKVNFWLAVLRTSTVAARVEIKTALLAAEIILDEPRK